MVPGSGRVCFGCARETSELFAEMTDYLVQDMRGERCMGIGRFISEMRRLQGAHGEPDTRDPTDLKSAVCLKYIYNFCKVYVHAKEYQDLIDNDDDHYVVNPYKELICFSYVQSDAYTRWSAWWPQWSKPNARADDRFLRRWYMEAN